MKRGTALMMKYNKKPHELNLSKLWIETSIQKLCVHFLKQLAPPPPKKTKNLWILLVEEILHHLGCKKKSVNNGIDYQPQLVQDF